MNALISVHLMTRNRLILSKTHLYTLLDVLGIPDRFVTAQDTVKM